VTPLGQEEMFDPPPTRRLIVREGHTAWWGVDPSTLRVAIGTVSGRSGARAVHTVSFPRHRGVERLSVIYQATREIAGALAHAEMPGVIVVEQPSGKKPNLELVYAVGVILVALAHGAGLSHVETVSSSTWKKTACGHGGIRKPKFPSEGEYQVLTWAHTVGLQGDSWDEADAYGLAEHARKTFMLDVR
jgi:Holliday junction resolvasome RuvABC endonuclease subunit